MEEFKTIPKEILGSSKSDLIQSTNCPHYSARHSTERFDDPFPLSVPEREVEFTEEGERHIAERHPDLLPEHRSRIEKTLADLRLAATRRGPGAMSGATGHGPERRALPPATQKARRQPSNQARAWSHERREAPQRRSGTLPPPRPPDGRVRGRPHLHRIPIRVVGVQVVFDIRDGAVEALIQRNLRRPAQELFGLVVVGPKPHDLAL